MNEKVIEKLKDVNFFKEVVAMDDEGKVKEMFKKENIDINDEDLNGIRNFIEVSLEVASKLSDEDLKDASGGEGIVSMLSGKLDSYVSNKDGRVPFGEWNNNHYECIFNNSDKIVEGALAAAIAGISVGGTIGVQKLIKTGKEKGWLAKKK